MTPASSLPHGNQVRDPEWESPSEAQPISRFLRDDNSIWLSLLHIINVGVLFHVTTDCQNTDRSGGGGLAQTSWITSLPSTHWNGPQHLEGKFLPWMASSSLIASLAACPEVGGEDKGSNSQPFGTVALQNIKKKPCRSDILARWSLHSLCRLLEGNRSSSLRY